MRFRAKKPEFSEVDGEYVVPIRLSYDLMHNLCSGWWPLGFGWAHLRPRAPADGSYDLFIRQAMVSEDLNLVKLDAVQAALMAALDLAQGVAADESLVSDSTADAAREVVRLVAMSAG